MSDPTDKPPPPGLPPEPLPRETAHYADPDVPTAPPPPPEGTAPLPLMGGTAPFPATVPSQRGTDIDPDPPTGPEERSLQGAVIAQRYVVLRELGRGGMGSVYHGHHLTLDVPVAVKVMLPRYAADPVWLERFHREAKATSKLNHRNVVRVLDFGAHEGLPYLVMELLEGQSVAEWLMEAFEPPSIAEIEPVMLGVFDAFEAAHENGIVHRDLKPDNVFMARESDGETIIKILDFGLAHMSEPGSASLTTDDMVSGTPEYMSPEQCRSLKVGPATDIYAIGCLLTEMLQLEPPFGGETHVDIMTKQMFYEPPKLQRPSFAEPIPPLLEKLRLDLLSKRPQHRPATVAEARARFLEAIDPDATAERLPPRKSAPPDGSRADRAPTWDEAEASSTHPTRAPGHVAIWRRGDDARGVDEQCVAAMVMQGTRVTPIQDATRAGEFGVVIVDAVEGGLEAATEMTQAIGGSSRVVICLPEVTTEAMGQLIAAGADAVMGYPIEPAKLSRKVARQLKRAAAD